MEQHNGNSPARYKELAGAFDEVAGITFKDKDGVQIMKDGMASGSFARGK